MLQIMVSSIVSGSIVSVNTMRREVALGFNVQITDGHGLSIVRKPPPFSKDSPSRLFLMQSPVTTNDANHGTVFRSYYYHQGVLKKGTTDAI
jgi:hypothetical protein